MSTASNGGRRFALRSALAVSLTGASWVVWELFDSDADQEEPLAPAEAVARVSTAQLRLSTPSSEPLQSKPAISVSPPQARPEPEEQPVRQAVDSGRAQPVFFNLMGARDVRVGRPFQLGIAVESENDFATVALTVRYDAKQLRLVGVRAGSFLSQAGASASLGHAVDPDSGQLRLNISQYPGSPPVSGGGTLAILEFVPTARGAAAVSIAQAVVRDANNEGVPSAIGGTQAALTIRD